AKNAQAIGYTVIYMDSEGALTMDDLKKVGVNDDPEKFMPLSVTTTEEVISIFIDSLGIFDKEDKIMFVLDSASGLFSEKEESTLDGGKLQNDMGRSAKTAKQMIKSINSKIRTRDWFFIMSGHTYENMDMMSGDGKYKFSGLGAAAYFPSVTVLLTKLNLKDGKDQIGIKMNFVTKKTRYNQLGLSCRIDVPYDTGIDKYSGVLEILKEKGYVDGAGAWYSYGNADGEVVKFQSKTFADHAEFLIDRYESENNLAYEETEED
nr:hypothetical protein [Thiomicrorhabdus sp.]